MIDKKFLEYDINEVKKFVINKVKEAKIENINSIDFDYIEIKDLMPLNYYLNFTKFIEAATHIFKLDKMSADGGTNKLYWDLYPTSIRENFPTSIRENSGDKILDSYLNDLAELITLISKELFQKFEGQNLVPPHFKELKTGLQPFGQILVREDKNFSINPHLHGKQEVLDCLFYFPNTDVDITQGSVIYKKISDEVKVGGRETYENFDYKFFEEVKKFDYVPNSIIAWLNNGKSFHGANPVPAPLKENKKYVFFGVSNMIQPIIQQKPW